MSELLNYLDKITINALFVVATIYILSLPRNISILITIVTVFLSELFLIQLEPLLFNNATWSDPLVKRVAWYSLFSSMELFAAFSIVQLHKIYVHRFSKVSVIVVNIYLVLSLLNVTFFCSSFFISYQLLCRLHTASSALFLMMLFILFYHVVKNLELKQLITRWRNQA